MTSFTVPRGTQDVLPAAWRRRQRVIDVARERFERAGFGRISTPTFENTELFHRGVGEGTDIVGKETYTFEDRGGRSLTLRPEGTAPVSRAFTNHGMHREPLPVKLWYAMPMYRYEKPQAGRLREHEQLGCEVLGSDLAMVDADVIGTQAAIYRDLGLPDLKLLVNSVGSTTARAAYREALVAYLTPFRADLDRDSQERLTTNPLRILDSKDEGTRAVIADAPKLPEFLTAEDRAHFDEVRALLDAVNVDVVVEPLLVRGLDYYSRTVWEFTSSALGAQSTVGAGGRYDGLVEVLGGPATPAVGFGSGVERIVLCLEAMEASAGAGDPHGGANAGRVDVYVGCSSDATSAGRVVAFELVAQLRDAGLRAELDLGGRSPKGQAKQAAKLGASARVLVDGAGAMHLATRGADDRVLAADVVDAVRVIGEIVAGLRA